MRAGVTLVEMSVAAGLFGLLIGTCATLWSTFGSKSRQAIESCDAVHSVAIAAEFIRRDVERMYFQEAQQDLAIPDHGRGLSFRLPQKLQGDLWTVYNEPVSYYLRRVPANVDVFQLIRKDGAGERVIRGCYLEEMLVRYVAPAGKSRYEGFLEVTLAGLGTAEGGGHYTGTFLLPVQAIKRPPMTYVPGRGST
jgi:hypothetical protein